MNIPLLARDFHVTNPALPANALLTCWISIFKVKRSVYGSFFGTWQSYPYSDSEILGYSLSVLRIMKLANGVPLFFQSRKSTQIELVFYQTKRADLVLLTKLYRETLVHFYRSLVALIAFVLSLITTVVAQLCYSSTVIDRHSPDGYKVRIEINDDADPQDKVQWQLILLLLEGFNDRNSILCFNAPVAPADSNSIAILVTNDLSNYCYQLTILSEGQIPIFQHVSKGVSENGITVRLKSTTADRPELTSVNTDPLLNNKPHATSLILLAYSDNMTVSGLETQQALNNTMTLTGGKLTGIADFSSDGGGGFFYSLPPPPPPGGGGRPSGLFEIDLLILKPVITWLMSIGKDSISFDQQSSPAHLKITRVNGDGSSSEVTIPVSWLDFLDIEQLIDVDFWNTLLRRAANTCPASESLQWQLGCFKLFLESAVLKAGNGDGQPSYSVSDAGPENGNNDHQEEEREEPEDQEGQSSGEDSDGSGNENNRKDDDGDKSEKNATTQDLQELADQLIAIIEGSDRNAVYKLRQILDELDRPQRLQVLETKGTNIRGNTVTPLEAVLALPRSCKENSLRNRFIEQLIEATSDTKQTLNDLGILSSLQPIIPTDETLLKVGENNLMILHKIVQDIIHRVNQPDQQPPIGQFEKCCFTEYFVHLFLNYSNPIELIRNLLGKISDVAISHDIMIYAQSFTFSTSFLDTLIRFDQHPSSHELISFSEKLYMQLQSCSTPQEPLISNSDNIANEIIAINANTFTDPIQQVDSYQSTSGSVGSSSNLTADRYLQQGARPKQPGFADRQNDSSQKRASLGQPPDFPTITPGNAVNADNSPDDHRAKNLKHKLNKLEGVVSNYLRLRKAIDLKRIAKEKEEQKRQQIERQQTEKLTVEVQRLTIENQGLTQEVQGVRAENQELAIKNQNLTAVAQRLWKRVTQSDTENQRLRENIEKLEGELGKQQELIDLMIQQALQQVAAASPAMSASDPKSSASCPQSSLPDVKANRSGGELPLSRQESIKPMCEHYHRRCLVKFKCCGLYFPCHRCHNASPRCQAENCKASDATHLQCTVCEYEGEITDGSQTCPGCNERMSDFFCAKCKHFISAELNPYHCDKCGICRVYEEKNYHCDVCNICLNKKLKGDHICRPDSGHDECCICLEDAFGGCQILPCSHRVHRECADAMIQNGVTSCPVCRDPFRLR